MICIKKMHSQNPLTLAGVPMFYIGTKKCSKINTPPNLSNSFGPLEISGGPYIYYTIPSRHELSNRKFTSVNRLRLIINKSKLNY